MENEKYNLIFFDADVKARAFDEIAKLFYDKNFSSATKTEIELLMFSIYMNATIDMCKREDGTIDYNTCSDYEMGRELGVPQEKVRALKIKKQARYPVNFDWRNSLLSIKETIRYDEGKGKIIIPTRDPNLYNEIRNYIENHGGYIEIQRSGNVVQIRPEHFFLLMYEGMDEKEQKNCRKELERQLHLRNKENTLPASENIMDIVKRVGTLGKVSLEILSALSTVVDSPLLDIIKLLV